MKLPERRKTWEKFFTTLMLLALCMVIFDACSDENQEPHQNNPTVTNRIIDSASSLLISGKLTLSSTYLDSAYNHFPDAGPLDLWKKYQMKNNFYTSM